MPALGTSAVHGAEAWAKFVLDHLSTESVLLRAGARFIPITGRAAHVPRLLTDGAASWVAEGAEIPSNAPTGDQIVLLPKKLANVVVLSRESIEDAPVDELDTVGNALTRGVATSIDTQAFSTAAATTTTPAGIRSYAIPAQTGGITIDNVVRASGTIGASGAVANAVFVNPTDLTTLRLQKDTAGRPLLQPDLQAAGAERIAGARVYPTPALTAGNALVADARQIIVGVRRDIAVDFSNEARFTADSVAARVTSRVDWAINDIRGMVAIGA